MTQKLNVALSNRPWTDAAAEVIAPTGKDAGLGKRSLLNRYSVLLLNKDIVDPHTDAWTEHDIATRAPDLGEGYRAGLAKGMTHVRSADGQRFR